MAMTEPGHDLHRTTKALVDAGIADSFAAAERSRHRHIRVELGEDPTHAEEAAALTAIACASRVFGPTVSFSGPAAPAQSAAYAGSPIAAAARHLGAQPTDHEPDLIIAIASEPETRQGVVAVSIEGWDYSITAEPTPSGKRPSPWFVGIAAGAHAVSEAALHLLFRHPTAALRRLDRNLWRPDLPRTVDEAPTDVVLPADLWLIGLGHLGQGTAWALTLAPTHTAPHLHVTVQDIDQATTANISTGLLTTTQDVGAPKTRVVSTALERAGARTAIVERRLDAATQHQPDDPAVAIMGVDNTSTRRLISDLDAPLTLDVAIGAHAHNLSSIVMRAFPDLGNSRAVSAWSATSSPQALSPSPAYAALAEDTCGQILIAGRAAGAAFVGAYAGAVVAAELARRAVNAPSYPRIDIDLRSSDPWSDPPRESEPILRTRTTPADVERPN